MLISHNGCEDMHSPVITSPPAHRSTSSRKLAGLMQESRFQAFFVQLTCIWAARWPCLKEPRQQAVRQVMSPQDGTSFYVASGAHVEVVPSVSQGQVASMLEPCVAREVLSAWKLFCLVLVMILCKPRGALVLSVVTSWPNGSKILRKVDVVCRSLMLATMTALQKRDGGVRGIATGTSFRRLVAKTLARQFSDAVEAACAPLQFALSTRAGVDCVGHAVRGATELNPNLTVLSIDGVGAFDCVYCASMLEKLVEVPSLQDLLPFVKTAYASASAYVWADEAGVRHTIEQHEGGNTTPSCLCCSIWAYRTPLRKCGNHWTKENGCSHSLMMCM